jgi:demethylmenaquinone methyltransferase / 2-methoxy-6-polyprenyl-1,4-benzoquinol methylase
MNEASPGSAEIREMFNAIAPEYDKLNHVFTLGIDRLWRKKLIRIVQPLKNKKVLDIATGTGDLAYDLLKKQPEFVQGVDFSEKMVDLCKQKMKRKRMDEHFSCLRADVELLPFSDSSFDVVTIAFGIRNFQNMTGSLNEIYRVLKPQGTLVILEFFHSKFAKRNVLYKFYMKKLMPFIGKYISGHPWAYRYLFESIQRFYSEDEFQILLKNNNFSNVRKIKLAFGIAFIIVCRKQD